MSCYRTDTSAWPVEIHLESFELVVFGHWKTSVRLVGEGSGWFWRYVFFRNPNSENHCWNCWILFWVVQSHSQRNIGYWWLGFVDDCETMYCTYTDIRHILFLYVYYIYIYILYVEFTDIIYIHSGFFNSQDIQIRKGQRLGVHWFGGNLTTCNGCEVP